MLMKILIIEDHQAMIEGYKSILDLSNSGIIYKYFEASTFDDALLLLNRSHYDLILLDINLADSKSSNTQNGKELGLYIRKNMPSAKILILTSHIEKIILYTLVREIDPNGLLVKSDFKPEELIFTVQKILSCDKRFYSHTVQKSINEVAQEKVYLDSINREIIILLDRGIQTKSLPAKLLLSQSAIDKRKAHIKEVLGIVKGCDEDLLTKARKMGLI